MQYSPRKLMENLFQGAKSVASKAPLYVALPVAAAGIAYSACGDDGSTPSPTPTQDATVGATYTPTSGPTLAPTQTVGPTQTPLEIGPATMRLNNNYLLHILDWKEESVGSGVQVTLEYIVYNADTNTHRGALQKNLVFASDSGLYVDFAKIGSDSMPPGFGVRDYAVKTFGALGPSSTSEQLEQVLERNYYITDEDLPGIPGDQQIPAGTVVSPEFVDDIYQGMLEKSQATGVTFEIPGYATFNIIGELVKPDQRTKTQDRYLVFDVENISDRPFKGSVLNTKKVNASLILPSLYTFGGSPLWSSNVFYGDPLWWDVRDPSNFREDQLPGTTERYYWHIERTAIGEGGKDLEGSIFILRDIEQVTEIPYWISWKIGQLDEIPLE